MIIYQFVAEISREVDDKIDAQKNALVRGIHDRDEYWRQVGIIQGLMAAKDYITDLANRIDKADDDN